MTPNSSLFRIKYAILILFLCVIVKADVMDVISAETAPGDNVCWAACADMLLQYNGNDPNLNGLWAKGTNIDFPDVTNGLCAIANTSDSYDVHDLLSSNNNSYPVASTCGTTETIPLSDIIKDLLNAKPIIAGLSDNNKGHMVLIVGEKDADETIYYNDPEYGTQENISYDNFCTNGTTWYWAENLVPDEPCTGTVPILPLSIVSGPTQFTYPGSSVTFQSLFTCPGVCNPPPTQWTWSLFFNYNGGSYMVSSQTVNGQGMSTFNVPAFVLPTSGYYWMYNVSGMVMGEVYVTGGGYSAWETITYSPQTLIPAIVDFGGQNVSGSHSEIDSHYRISIDNDQIANTGVINFKAGDAITILPETKILSGSSVNLTINPSLQ